MKVTDISDNFFQIVGKFAKKGKYQPLVKISKKIFNGQEYCLLKYTHAAQQARAWVSDRFSNEEQKVLTYARGMVYNSQSGEIVALPFLKFHNFDTLLETDTVPQGQFSVYNKVDGNLVVLAFYEGSWNVTSSG